MRRIQPGVLAAVMELTEPALWEPAPGETLAQRRAREAARADIVDDLLSEIAGSQAGDEISGWLLADVEGWAA